MSRPATERDRGKHNRGGGSVKTSTPPPRTKPAPEEILIATFNSLADELVSTLSFILGNADDAQDIAQDAFLRLGRPYRVHNVYEFPSWLERYALYSAPRAAQRVRFMDQYRSYVINYNLGKDLVRAYVEKQAGRNATPAARWRAFTALLSSPRLPSGLQ